MTQLTTNLNLMPQLPMLPEEKREEDTEGEMEVGTYVVPQI